MVPLAAAEWTDAGTLKSVFVLAAPEAWLLVAACAIFLGGTIRASRNLWAIVSLLALVVAALIASYSHLPGNFRPEASPLAPDALAEFVRWLAYGGGAVLLLLSWSELSDERAADYFACFLVLVAGVSLVGSANELITIFLCLEMISIPTYVLLYLPKAGPGAREAAIKYFLLSVFSSGLLLFGFSYLYGVSGTTNLTTMFQEFGRLEQATTPGLALIAFVMVIAGLGFRITAVPFHFYAPDVFQGAPTSLGALLAFVPKVAGFAALIRLLGFLQSVPGTNLISESRITLLLWLLAVITMTVGNVVGLMQTNLKRLLAYSSVAHGGYMLMGMAASLELRANTGPGSLQGHDAVLFYLVAYGAMTIGAFAVIAYLSTANREATTVDDLAGLGRSHPGLALMMALFLFSLIGLPWTAGFWGKLQLFFSAVAVERSPEQQPLFVILAVIAAVNAAIGAYYYLRIVSVMFLRDALKPLQPVRQWPTLATLVVCAAITLVLGVYPSLLIPAARLAATPTAPIAPAHAAR